MEKTKIMIIPFFISVFSRLSSQQNMAIRGKVMDSSTLELIQNATVQLLPQEAIAITKANGTFEFDKMKNGKQTLMVSMVGYITQLVEINDGKEIAIALQERIMGLEEVEVTAKPKLFGSSSVIDKSAIIHTQPTSLADVLQLIPGQLAVNPNLGAAQQINLRQVPSTTDAGRANALGTQIIVDGVPISNNGNLQTDITILNSSAGASPPFS
ncbi:MAG: TonB-dependent receptor, partial [Spirosomataceae bacterium]